MLKMISVQGHTRDSTCFLWEEGGRRALFTGDVVFYSGAIGLINADGSSLEDYRRDLPKLAALGVDMFFPGHSVFVLRNGQKHIDRALKKLQDFVLPESFFETNEFMWQTDYASSMK
jgi:glyoxylase-like metal-dependent hydrolase (beta-lactamase superfamily II)